MVRVPRRLAESGETGVTQLVACAMGQTGTMAGAGQDLFQAFRGQRAPAWGPFNTTNTRSVTASTGRS